MNLGDLITRLEAADPDQTARHGFTHPHSYRGDYMDLAFEPAIDVTVADMLAAARSAIGATFQGWKGGDFTMTEHTWCWLSQEGDASGETISALLLELMLQPAAVVSVVPSRADTLTAADRQFLAFALDRAAEEKSLGDGFTDEDHAALDKLRRLAAGESQS